MPRETMCSSQGKSAVTLSTREMPSLSSLLKSQASLPLPKYRKGKICVVGWESTSGDTAMLLVAAVVVQQEEVERGELVDPPEMF